MSAKSTPEPDMPGGSSSELVQPRQGRRRKPCGKRKGLLIVAWISAGIVVLGGTGTGYLYFTLNGNIKSVDINQALGTHRPQKIDNGSENILVLGSDSRSGGNKKLGGGPDNGSARSDTAMILHVYEGRKEASVVSVPRDTLIERPRCTDTKGHTYPPASGVMFNLAYTTGGAACSVKTAESMTGVRIDHYLEVDFSGFQKLIDELGGVKVTTTKNIEDPRSHLKLKAGTHRLNGKQALGLVRTRHGVGDGSDLGRIQLQQAFIKALTKQFKNINLFGNPKRLYDLANTATKTVTTDSDLGSVNRLMSFANGLKGISSRNMTMVTMPVQYAPADPNRLIVAKAKAEQVWTALKNDKPIPKTATEDTAKGDANGVLTGS
ncbi:LCP family protein [Streptomyces sp. NPDC048419]|uniref:LCP family protein n=1 Tax=Streptomyces sp. NPDC048419 TaxID=3365547 RepID=UPI0037134B98